MSGGKKLFFRESKSKKSKNPTLQLVESIRTENGSSHKIIISLGTKFFIPKDKQSRVAKIVHDRLLGQKSLFNEELELVNIADKIICKIQSQGKWNSAREQVSKTKKIIKDTAEVIVDNVQHCYSRELGPVLIGHHYWNLLNFDDILKNCNFKKKDLQTAKISILNRLIDQYPEYRLPEWLETVALDDIDQIDKSQYEGQYGKDRFYNISDKILLNQDYIEKNLYDREKTLFNLEDCIYLYDLTNTYFEGLCVANRKAEFGGNQKEKRNDCRQIVIAIFLDGEGFIRGHRVFNGKISDSKSLKIIMEQLKSEFKDKKLPTIIFDRGVVSEDNLELLKEYDDNLKYIVACRSSEEKQFIEDFQNKNDHFELIEGREEKSEVKILLKEKDDKVYVLCSSEGRMSKEKAMRTKAEEKFEAELSNLAKQIKNGKQNNPVKIERRIGKLKGNYSKVSKYYEIEYEHREFDYNIPEGLNIPKRLKTSLIKLKEKAEKNILSFSAIEKKVEERLNKYPEVKYKIEVHLKEAQLSWYTIDEKEAKEESLDGNYLLKTNRKDLKGNEIWNIYMMLTRLENAFRDLKSHLGLRPVFHHLEKRVDGHVCISILTYHLLHSIEYKLRNCGIKSRWATIKRIMRTHTYTTIQLPTINGSVINVRKPGKPEGVHEEIYKKLEVDYLNLPVRKIIA